MRRFIYRDIMGLCNYMGQPRTSGLFFLNDDYRPNNNNSPIFYLQKSRRMGKNFPKKTETRSTSHFSFRLRLCSGHWSGCGGSRLGSRHGVRRLVRVVVELPRMDPECNPIIIIILIFIAVIVFDTLRCLAVCADGIVF